MKPMEVKLRSKMSHWPKIPHRYVPKCFLWVCWFLDKKLSNFIHPILELHPPYCHILHQQVWCCDKLVSGKMVHHQGIFEWVELFVKTTNLSGMLTFDFIVNEADQEFCTGCSLKLNPAFSIFTDETQVHMHIKGSPVEKTLVYLFSTYDLFLG